MRKKCNNYAPTEQNYKGTSDFFPIKGNCHHTRDWMAPKTFLLGKTDQDTEAGHKAMLGGFVRLLEFLAKNSLALNFLENRKILEIGKISYFLSFFKHLVSVSHKFRYELDMKKIVFFLCPYLDKNCQLPQTLNSSSEKSGAFRTHCPRTSVFLVTCSNAFVFLLRSFADVS